MTKSDNIPRLRLTADEYAFVQDYRKMKRIAYQKDNSEETIDQLIVTSKIAQSIEDIIKEYKIDTSLWECTGFKPGNWTTPLKAKFKHEDINVLIPIMMENRKSEAVFKKKIQIIDYEGFRKGLIEDIKRLSPKIKLIKKEKKSGNLLEVNMPDLHLGKLAWGEETGNKNYDIKIAIKRFEDATDEMLSMAVSENEFEKILFVVGNDLFNSDSNYPFSTTTAGTPMQDDVRWQKVFRYGRNLIIDTIDKLKHIAPVEVKVVPGNHEEQKCFYLGEVLEARFYNDENVTIDNSPTHRKYFHWGKCLLGFAHGNRKDEPEQRLLDCMYSEAVTPETVYKEWHCGDIHHYKESRQAIRRGAEDVDGIIIRYLRTLMYPDEYEAKKGYISQKGAHMFVWNKEDGNTVIYNYNR